MFVFQSVIEGGVRRLFRKSEYSYYNIPIICVVF